MDLSIDPSTILLLAIPIALLDLVMKVVALMGVHKAERVRGGNKIVWVALILMVNMLGWAIWFMAGKEDE